MRSASREFFERALSDAEAIGDRVETRLIALRIVELIESDDFDEWGRLSVRPILTCDYAGEQLAAD